MTGWKITCRALGVSIVARFTLKKKKEAISAVTR